MFRLSGKSSKDDDPFYIGLGTIVFDNWEIIERIKTYSFGTVYKIQRKTTEHFSFEKEHQQYAALKVIYIPHNESEIEHMRNMGMDDDNIKKYYHQEVEFCGRSIDIISQVKGHSNIVSYDDYEIRPQELGFGSIILIKMEFLHSIAEPNIEDSINEELTIKLGIDICQALEACEKKNIIHRNIKPSTIYVNEYGSFKLGDFDIATTEFDLGFKTMAETSFCMAPEVYSHQKYNNMVDIYSLGLVLYKYLNGGRLPFFPTLPQKVHIDDCKEAVAKRISGQAIPPIANIDPELNEIVCKACSFEARNRYQSPKEFKIALLNYQLGYKKHKQLIEPYEGPDPFIFVSYSHKNEQDALSLVNRLQKDGFRVWFDYGIKPGSEWDECIARYVANCSIFIALISKDSLQSSNCKDELYYARNKEKNRVLIYLDDVELPGGMELRLSRLQNIHKSDFSNEEDLYRKLYTMSGLEACKSEIPCGQQGKLFMELKKLESCK